MDKTAYLEHFKVTEENLRELTGLALSKGGDFADLYFEHTVYNELSMRDGQVNSGGSHIDYGMGIRVLKGEKTGYAYTESTEWEDMRRAALNAAMIADSPRERNRATPTPTDFSKTVFPESTTGPWPV